VYAGLLGTPEGKIVVERFCLHIDSCGYQEEVQGSTQNEEKKYEPQKVPYITGGFKCPKCGQRATYDTAEKSVCAPCNIVIAIVAE